MADKILFGRPDGFKTKFSEMSEDNNQVMHYCPGCGHGIAHKIIAEAISDFQIKDRTIIISPVGCAVFAYRYFDCAGISVPHGRAPAVGSGLSRANPDNVVISYQGDGDLGAIGLAEIIHAANRGENMCVVFVNNAIYGMTGGQMAPTTLVGQKTVTSPTGRDCNLDGNPIKISEIIATLESVIYVERVALSNPKSIMQARSAIRKGILNSVEKKGFSFVEVLSGCPVGLKCDPVAINEFIDDKLSKFFPLGVFKDNSSDAPKKEFPLRIVHDNEIIELLTAGEKCSDAIAANGLFPKTLRIKVAGSGGQGILLLGEIIAQIGKQAGYNVSFLPAYGPEMRGGTANCSVIISRDLITSPLIEDNIDLLVAMNELSLRRYGNSMREDGKIIYDNSTGAVAQSENLIQLAATVLAVEKCGNTKSVHIIMLGSVIRYWLGKINNPALKRELLALAEGVITTHFANKTKLKELNLKALKAGLEIC